MAKTRSRAVTVYSPPRAAAAPIIRVNVPRARAAPKAKRRHHRRGGGGGGGNLKDRMVKVAIGGAIIGYVEKTGIAFPTVPMLGRVGSMALAAYFMGGQRPGLLQDVAIAGACLSGYELAKEGKISGDDD